jgi:uncharacterized protein YkwD
MVFAALIFSAGAVQPSPKLQTRSLLFEEELAALVNQERKAAGVPALKKSPLLSRIARNHSRDMSSRGFFNHTNPDGWGPKARLEEGGYLWQTFGENIGCGQESLQRLLEAWLKNPDHRKNIMDPSFKEIGIGFVAEGSCSPYWTALFASPLVR